MSSIYALCNFEFWIRIILTYGIGSLVGLIFFFLKKTNRVLVDIFNQDSDFKFVYIYAASTIIIVNKDIGRG